MIVRDPTTVIQDGIVTYDVPGGSSSSKIIQSTSASFISGMYDIARAGSYSLTNYSVTSTTGVGMNNNNGGGGGYGINVRSEQIDLTSLVTAFSGRTKKVVNFNYQVPVGIKTGNIDEVVYGILLPASSTIAPDKADWINLNTIAANPTTYPIVAYFSTEFWQLGVDESTASQGKSAYQYYNGVNFNQNMITAIQDIIDGNRYPKLKILWIDKKQYDAIEDTNADVGATSNKIYWPQLGTSSGNTRAWVEYTEKPNQIIGRKKRYQYRLFNSSGTYLGELANVTSDPTFTTEINSAGCEMVVSTAQAIASMDSNIDFGNIIKVYQSDNTQDGSQKIFEGEITQIETNYIDDTQEINIHLLSRGFDLAKSVFFSKDDTTTYTTYLPTGSSSTLARSAGSGMAFFMNVGSLESLRKFSLYTDSAASNFIYAIRIYGNKAAPPLYGDSTYLLAGYQGGSYQVITIDQTAAAYTPSRYEQQVQLNTELDISQYDTLWIEFECQASTNIYYHATPVGDAIYYTQTALSATASWALGTGALDVTVYEPSDLYTYTYTDTDPALILADLINNYRSQGGVIGISASSVDLIGQAVTYTFKVITLLDAIQKLVDLCPAGYYWYVNPADNTLYLKDTYTSIIDHSLFIGRHITGINLKVSSEGIINEVFFSGGDDGSGSNLFRKSSNDSLIDSYGLRAVVVSDNRVTQTDTADLIANSILDSNNGVTAQAQVTVVDASLATTKGGISGYDIESLRVGQIIKFENAGESTSSMWDEAIWDQSYWDSNYRDLGTVTLQIGRLAYTGNKMVIEAYNLPTNVSKQLRAAKVAISYLDTQNNPDSPTIV